MKKNLQRIAKGLILTCATTLLMSSNALAQNQVPNAGFENWVQDPNGMGASDMMPGLWENNNAYFDGSIFVTQSTPGNAGNYAVKVAVALDGNFFVPRFGLVKTKFAIAARPLNLTGYLKSDVTGGDSVSINIVVKNGASFVGLGSKSYATSTISFTAFTIPITYTGSGVDSAFIFIKGGRTTGPQTGTFIIVDDLAFSGFVGINEMTDDAEIVQYPNPTTGRFTIETENKNLIDKIEVYTILGEKVYSLINNKQTSNEIDLSGFSKEMYFVKIYVGEKIVTKKIVVQ